MPNDANFKIIALNQSALEIRDAIKAISNIYQKDEDVQHFIWRLNKNMSDLHQCICKKLADEVMNEQFKDIIKDIDK